VQKRNFINAIFGNIKRAANCSIWKEVGAYRAIFSSFGTDLYADEVVRSCVRALAEHSSKANVRCVRRIESDRIDGDKMLEKMIQYQPNMYMNGKDFIYKVRTRLELDNTSFIFIERNEFNKCIGLYPMPKATLEAFDVGGQLYISFSFANGNKTVLPWDDLAVLRKDYNTSDIFGDSNSAILSTLELLTTTNEGLGNAIKSTSNLRGILKSTKGMLSPDDLKTMRTNFITDYMSIANEGGIAALDATQEFNPITMVPQTANYKHIEELRNNIYRYFGVNDDILMSKVSGDAWEAFYEARLEPFLIALGLELTNKIFTDKQKGFGNEIIFEANRLAYISMSNKLSLVQMVDRGAMTPNEWREVMNLAPIEGGDQPIRRLDTAPTSTVATNINEKEEEDDNKG